MGDDQTNEYIYRFVSALAWRTARARGLSPLDEGVAPRRQVQRRRLRPVAAAHPVEPGAVDLDDRRTSSSTPGARPTPPAATKMDRPEWIDTIPDQLRRPGHAHQQHAPAPWPTPPNLRGPNTYGHILKWWYANDFSEPTFQLGDLRPRR